MDEKEKCCICGKEINGMGNNPYPVRTEGRCCRYCNYTVVLPERVRLYGKQARQPVVQATKKGRTGQYPQTRYLLRRGWRAVQDKADKATLQ